MKECYICKKRLVIPAFREEELSYCSLARLLHNQLLLRGIL